MRLFAIFFYLRSACERTSPRTLRIFCSFLTELLFIGRITGLSFQATHCNATEPQMNAAEQRYLTVVDSSRCRLEGRCLHCLTIFGEEDIRKYAEINEDCENASFFITCFACGALADVNLIVELRDHDGSVTYQVFEYYNQKQLLFALHQILQRSGKPAFELKELASQESSVLWNLTYYYGGKQFLFDERLPIHV